MLVRLRVRTRSSATRPFFLPSSTVALQAIHNAIGCTSVVVG